MTTLISWHIHGSWLSVWRTFSSLTWPIASLTLSLRLPVLLVYHPPVTPVSLLCLKYDMFTLALEVCVCSSLCLEHCFPWLVVSVLPSLFNMGPCSVVFLPEILPDHAHPCLLLSLTLCNMLHNMFNIHLHVYLPHLLGRSFVRVRILFSHSLVNPQSLKQCWHHHVYPVYISWMKEQM